MKWYALGGSRLTSLRAEFSTAERPVWSCGQLILKTVNHNKTCALGAIHKLHEFLWMCGNTRLFFILIPTHVNSICDILVLFFILKHSSLSSSSFFFFLMFSLFLSPSKAFYILFLLLSHLIQFAPSPFPFLSASLISDYLHCTDYNPAFLIVFSISVHIIFKHFSKICGNRKEWELSKVMFQNWRHSGLETLKNIYLNLIIEKAL